MKKMLVVFNLLLLSVSAFGEQTSSRFIRADAEGVICSHETNTAGNRICLGISVTKHIKTNMYETQKMKFDSVTGDRLEALYRQCQASRIQSGSVYINIDTGEVNPESGFYVLKPLEAN